VVTGLYVSLVGVLGACFGLIIKHTAGAITTLIAALYVIPVLLQVFPESFRSHALRFLPNSIGEQAATIVPLSDHFSPWAGIGMMAVYAAVLFTLGSMLVQRRDA
jgi:hypothetical protein